MYTSIFIIIFSQISISYTYKTSPTPWFCTDPNALDSTVEVSRKLPTCSPGYVIDIEDVVYESTVDGTCSGKSLCSTNYKNTLSFACNNKQICDVETRQFRFHINSTCGATVRFFTKYRCLPVIQERKDYMCELAARRSSSADINLTCERNYRLHLSMALVGISVKPQDTILRERFQCNKNTYWICNQYVSDAYRNVCNNQLNHGTGNQCRIRSNDRPRLKGCVHGEASNFSLVEFSCIPGEGIMEDLPRVDICSNKFADRIPFNRGLLHSPNYPQPLGAYTSCIKRLYVSRESRLRLFMLEKSLEYFHELNIRLLFTEPNIQRTLAKNELLDTNITSQQGDETVEIDLKTKHVGGGNFLLYFQVDSRISDNAPTVFETDRTIDDSNRQAKIFIKRDWGIVIGSLIGILLVLILIAIVLIVIRMSKRRRARSLKYLKNNDDASEHLNALSTVNDHSRPTRGIQIEHPHLLSNAPKIITSSVRDNENTSDCESLLKHPSPTNPIRNKPYREPTSFEDNKTSPVNRDHRENEQNRRRPPAPLATPERDRLRLGNFTCDAPMASTETLDVGGHERMKRPQQTPPKIPPPRMDLYHPKPSAPPLHLLHSDTNENTQMPRGQHWNNKNNPIV